MLQRQLAGPLEGVGGLFAMSVDAARFVVRRPFQWREFLDQSWFVARVSMAPTLLVAIPFTVLVSFTLNILLRELGAADLSGAGAAFGAVTQVGPMVTVLIVAGAGATAMCADLGSRTVREEIDAMEVLGINPLHRLVVPRMLACAFVALFLNGMVSVVGIVGGYVFNVMLQGGTPGAYMSSFSGIAQLPDLYQAEFKALVFGITAGLVAAYKGLNAKGGPKGVGDAVNQTVVITFLILFFANLIMTLVYLQVVPAKGG
jgi:phospholipid/cholesterol/gamma-HCH transport system permease protein